MTANDYAKELHKLKLDQMAVEKRIIVRAKELCEQNPDVIIQLPCFINSYKASDMKLEKDIDVYTVLKIIETIEVDLAKKHPHKQTTIEFHTTQHEKIMNIAKDIQAINIPKSKI
jgi:hypothetical protein